MEASEAAKKAGKCRFSAFTGHSDPEAHAELLKASAKSDTVNDAPPRGGPCLLKSREHGLACGDGTRRGSLCDQGVWQGLKLEPRKMPADLIIVDSGQRTPVEN